MLLTIKDIAARLQVKDKTLYAWAAQGRIPTLKINGVLRFEPAAIDRWLRDCQTPTERSAPSAKSRRIKSARAKGWRQQFSRR
ncbi:MAG: helix-turn-helix domain-containing protein [Nitrospira sp.]|nr:helix-turn-helix domain-containing protein [Nitrospira sp.]MBX3304645.1 helix-turn-helix domain-containing protein [Nitrospira sp.]